MFHAIHSSIVNRRKALTALGAISLPAAAQTAKPMMLHVDVLVDPSHDAALKETYEKVFRPTIGKQPGFVSVRLQKFRVARAGNTPPAGAYKLLISFQTEEQRETWVASADHQRVWPQMEKHLKLVNAFVYDEI
jgi:antibiotic biosynthesis monooxygenase (ABM) superfamily enzyme